MTTRPVRRRSGFTLIELIVVIGIIVILASLAVLFLPNLDRNKGVPNAVAQFHGWVNLSRQQAIRDGTPHGIRLIQDPNNPNWATSAVYIEQPEPVAPRGPGIKVYIRTEPCYDPLLFPSNPGNIGDLSVVTLYQETSAGYQPLWVNPPIDGGPQTTWIDWDGVQPGDYFQLTGSPSVFAGIRRFTTPMPGYPPTPPPTVPAGLHKRAQLVLDRVIEGTERVIQNPTPPPPIIGNVITATNFRVIRQPRPLVGEATLQLHKDVHIDLTKSHPYPPGLPLPQAFPANFQAAAAWTPYTDPTTGPPQMPYLDILFNANGTVANAPYGQIILWVEHNERPNDNLLLSIFTRTGKTGPYSVYDLDPTQFDPYSVARTGQTPGL